MLLRIHKKSGLFFFHNSNIYGAFICGRYTKNKLYVAQCGAGHLELSSGGSKAIEKNLEFSLGGSGAGEKNLDFSLLGSKAGEKNFELRSGGSKAGEKNLELSSGGSRAG